jgi:hypothetical protein
VTRPGSTTPFWWGATISPELAAATLRRGRLRAGPFSLPRRGQPLPAEPLGKSPLRVPVSQRRTPVSYLIPSLNNGNVPYRRDMVEDGLPYHLDSALHYEGKVLVSRPLIAAGDRDHTNPRLTMLTRSH